MLNKGNYDDQPLFTVNSLVEAAIAQKGLIKTNVPRCCLLDPDGDLVRYLKHTGEAQKSKTWPCYHSDLYTFTRKGCEVGIVGCVVGASYAVLVAEELFYLGCETLISITSAGILEDALEPSFFMLIEKAIRDEGTSYHYLPPANFVAIHPDTLTKIEDVIRDMDIIKGIAWTTDAPFRETPARISTMKNMGAVVVEMEAAALYAFAHARGKRIVCLAHVTNRLGTSDSDFNKGENNSSEEMIAYTLCLWQKLRLAVSPKT